VLRVGTNIVAPDVLTIAVDGRADDGEVVLNYTADFDNDGVVELRTQFIRFDATVLTVQTAVDNLFGTMAAIVTGVPGFYQITFPGLIGLNSNNFTITNLTTRPGPMMTRLLAENTVLFIEGGLDTVDVDSSGARPVSLGGVNAIAGDSGSPLFVDIGPMGSPNLVIAGLATGVGVNGRTDQIGRYTQVSFFNQFILQSTDINGVGGGLFDITVDLSKSLVGNDVDPDFLRLTLEPTMSGNDLVVRIFDSSLGSDTNNLANYVEYIRQPEAGINTLNILGSNDDDLIFISEEVTALGKLRTVDAVGPTSSTNKVVFSPPVVASITADSGPLTNAAEVTYTVTFSEAVNGLDASDFRIDPTGGLNVAPPDRPRVLS
ncbi:MAG: hypothetical protein ACRDD1_07655, partial [Planctomycetia bacterium]